MALYMSTGFAALLLGPNAFDDIFRDAAIEIRSGPQPLTSDSPATGVLLGRITRDGAPWTAGEPSNGLRWFRDGRYAFKAPGHRWVLQGSATGEAGWFRVVANAPDNGAASAIAPRLDGAIGLLPEAGEPPAGDYQLLLPATAITPATAIQVGDAFWFALPPLE